MVVVHLVLVVMDFDVSGCRSYRHLHPRLYCHKSAKLVGECHNLSGERFATLPDLSFFSITTHFAPNKMKLASFFT